MLSDAPVVIASEECAVIERLQALCAYLARFRFNFTSEVMLQDGLEQVLSQAGVPVEREFLLDKRSRLDFMLPGGLVIEVKVDGSRADVLRQLSRYAQSPAVSGLLLVTTRASHRLPESFNGKPLAVHSLIPSML